MKQNQQSEARKLKLQKESIIGLTNKEITAVMGGNLTSKVVSCKPCPKLP